MRRIIYPTIPASPGSHVIIREAFRLPITGTWVLDVNDADAYLNDPLKFVETSIECFDTSDVKVIVYMQGDDFIFALRRVKDGVIVH